jgi:hypothetical protein
LKALAIKDQVGFSTLIRLIKFEPTGSKLDAEIETAIRQIVDKAVVSESGGCL